MNNIKESGDLTNYVESGEWHLRAVTAVRHVVYYPCCPNEPYPDITFQILIRRRVLYFLFNIILPCVWLSVLSLIGFWLPPDSGL
jgi:nicotinic acetylcholine receptor